MEITRVVFTAFRSPGAYLKLLITFNVKNDEIGLLDEFPPLLMPKIPEQSATKADGE
jgi:hypothetical protein